MEEIARSARVSIGTLYNHFGSREGLIDAVIPEVAGEMLKTLGLHVLQQPTTRQRLEAFIHGMIDLQHSNPALNDAVLQRYPDATALLNICEAFTALGKSLIHEAHREGLLAPDFSEDDLNDLLWLAATANRASNAPAGWRRVINRAVDSAWIDPPPEQAATRRP
ncbi:TetR/AcrR family transcriptional regulator [Dactylosporangium sp. CA-233914]|uniref:TetR/AcrR family transcriptional regulator n=1 Tax=Dactylosporangium sp. CA-233914 TaxID=3239934 RepID=UPI003D89D7DC